MSYAVIQTGGKQYKVKSGEILKIEKLLDSKLDKKIEFKETYESGIIWSHTLVDLFNFIMIKINDEKRTNFSLSPLDYNISAVYSKEDKFPQIMEILMLPLIILERRLGSAN